jgi:hypothetical protein
MPTSGLIRYTRLRRPASPSARFAADWAINPSFHLGGGAGAKSTPQTGLRHISNRSRTCRNGNWKMASGDWRRKATGFRAESPEFAGQRLGRASITRRNVGSTCTAGNRIGETALAGWLAGVGGFELSDPEKPPLEHGLTATEGRSARHIHCRNGLDWGASHSLAAQPRKVSDRQTLRNEGKFGPHFKGQFWKRHL